MYRLILLFLILSTVFDGECNISFCYTSSVSFDDSVRLKTQIRQALIKKYGWDWYFKNMVASPLVYIANFINHRSRINQIFEDDIEINCGLWLTNCEDSNDSSKIDYIKEAFDLMAENNDTIVHSFPFDGYTPYINFIKLKDDMKYRDSIFIDYLSSRLDDALYYAFNVGKYTKCFGLKGVTIPELIFERTGYISSDQLFFNYWGGNTKNEYIKKCNQLNFKPLLGHEDYIQAKEEEIKLLGKYIMLHDKEVLSRHSYSDIYMVNFIYKSGNYKLSTIIYPENNPQE